MMPFGVLFINEMFVYRTEYGATDDDEEEDEEEEEDREDTY